jgi:flagellar biosynthetic protein FliP
LIGAGPAPRPPAADAQADRADVRVNSPLRSVDAAAPKGREAAPVPAPGALAIDPQQAARSLTTVTLFGAASLAPAAVLMLTAFVRINIVLVLLRQALGSPQVPGNQVLTALALLLTALVMRPVGELVYARAVVPFAEGRASWSDAAKAASVPVKDFMIGQIERTGHTNYLWAIHDESAAPGAAEPQYVDECPFGVVATAYLLSELTTALVIGFYLYLPFLVVDLVVSAVLAAMGLYMLPPSLVALPLKLILFVLADGWLHVATMLLRSFGPSP